ncbi:MAG TPA: hypothetical protein VIT91_05255 [Chthoniobacterales bacterium]
MNMPPRIFVIKAHWTDFTRYAAIYLSRLLKSQTVKLLFPDTNAYNPAIETVSCRRKNT